MWYSTFCIRTSQLKCSDAVTRLDQLIGEALVEDAIDSCPSWERNCVYFVSWALDQLLKIKGQVLNWAEWQKPKEQEKRQRILKT